jgi:hypothetical protein
MISAAAIDQWLADHSLECSRFELRLSAASCERISREYPLRCVGCERATVAGSLPALPLPGKGMFRMETNRQKAALGGRRRAERIREKKAARAGIVLRFVGENEEIIGRLTALSEKDGTDPVDDLATIVELFLDGQLVLRKGAR